MYVNKYLLGWPINALTRTGTRPETRPEGGGAGRGRHFTLQGLSSQVYWHIEIRVFFKSIPEKISETRIFKAGEKMHFAHLEFNKFR